VSDPAIASRRRRMDIGTNQGTGDLTMRYGLRSQLAPLDCTSSRRSTVMCALRRATAVTTEYQRDSSSKRPLSSVAFAARSLLTTGHSISVRGAGSRVLEIFRSLSTVISIGRIARFVTDVSRASRVITIGRRDPARRMCSTVQAENWDRTRSTIPMRYCPQLPTHLRRSSGGRRGQIWKSGHAWSQVVY
jgi:hypothetical protein